MAGSPQTVFPVPKNQTDLPVVRSMACSEVPCPFSRGASMSWKLARFSRSPSEKMPVPR
jgi:hypothetical protein